MSTLHRYPSLRVPTHVAQPFCLSCLSSIAFIYIWCCNQRCNKFFLLKRKKRKSCRVWKDGNGLRKVSFFNFNGAWCNLMKGRTSKTIKDNPSHTTMEVGVWVDVCLNHMKCHHLTMHISFSIFVRKEGIYCYVPMEILTLMDVENINKFVMKPFDTICKHCVLVSSWGIYVKSLEWSQN
jgi:hypothetical protein